MVRKNIYKNMMAGIAFLMLGLFGIFFYDGGAAVANAAATGHVERIDISAYKDGQTTPKPTEEAYKDWLFAGWYSDEACTNVIRDKNSVEGKQYAKFVSSDVLSVKCQTKEGITETSTIGKLRLVSTVDSLNYQDVGFEIQFGEKKPYVYKTTSVCKTIEEVKDGVSFNHEPNAFHESSKYFVTVTLINIGNENFSTEFFIKPYWTTQDGSKVYGVTRYVRVEDSYLNIINVPVRLYTDENVVGGYLEVKYDNTNFQYVGYDNGDVFASHGAVESGNKIRCVAIMENIKSNVKADGMYLNLRFKYTGANLNEDVTFVVENEDFCDKDENGKALDVSNTVYKVIQ